MNQSRKSRKDSKFVSRGGEDWSTPWKNPKEKSRILTPAEALRMTQLVSLLEKERNQAFDYLLLRTSLTANKVEKKGWWILAGLFVYIEHNHRFPNMVEQLNFLENYLKGSIVQGDLPPLSKQDLVDHAEIERQAGALRIVPKVHYETSRKLNKEKVSTNVRKC